MKTRILCLITLLFISSTSPAQASTGWRYWGYFQAAPGAKTWSMAMTGPTTNVPDGSVEGWVFTFSGETVPEAAAPKIAPNFSSICKSSPAVAHKKRVAVVIDFGSAILRPRGESLPRAIVRCVVADKNATGADVVASVTKIRSASSGLICGINGYPTRECGQEIKTPKQLGK